MAIDEVPMRCRQLISLRSVEARQSGFIFELDQDRGTAKAAIALDLTPMAAKVTMIELEGAAASCLGLDFFFFLIRKA